jgi:hypothetical protein
MVTKLFMLVVNADEKGAYPEKRVNVPTCPERGQFRVNIEAF